MQVTALLFGMLIGIVVSLGTALIYGLWRANIRNRARNRESAVEMRDDVLIGFLVLASFALGVFLTYAVLSLHQ